VRTVVLAEPEPAERGPAGRSEGGQLQQQEVAGLAAVLGPAGRLEGRAGFGEAPLELRGGGPGQGFHVGRRVAAGSGDTGRFGAYVVEHGEQVALQDGPGQRAEDAVARRVERGQVGAVGVVAVIGQVVELRVVDVAQHPVPEQRGQLQGLELGIGRE